MNPYYFLARDSWEIAQDHKSKYHDLIWKDDGEPGNLINNLFGFVANQSQLFVVRYTGEMIRIY